MAVVAAAPSIAAVGGRRAGGFTLIEMMVTIAVLAVLVAIATPSFTTVINNNRLTSQANELVAALHTARSEALKINAPVSVCRSADGETCAGANGAWEQWVVVDPDDDMLRHAQSRAPVEVSADAHTVSFRGNGMAQSVANITVCLPTTRPAENLRRISIGAAGRVTVSSENGGGECP